MRHRPLTYPCLLLLTALLAPHAAFASQGSAGTQQPPPSATPAAPAADAAPGPTSDKGGADERAAQLYEEGNAFYDEGKHKEAEAKYQAAWDIARSFDVAGNLGNVEMLVGQPRDAAEHLTYALGIFPLGGGAEKKKFLQSRLDEAKKQIGTLQISVNVEGAEVFIDGKQVGKSPLPEEVFVEPGEHVVEARLGKKVKSESLLVTKGSLQSVVLSIDTGPDMMVVAIGGAAGAVGLATGLVFAIMSTAKASDGDALHTKLEKASGSAACNVPTNKASCDDLAGMRDDEATFGNIAVWSFISGGAALTGTAVYMLTMAVQKPGSEPAMGLHAVPVVTAKGGGLMIGGSF